MVTPPALAVDPVLGKVTQYYTHALQHTLLVDFVVNTKEQLFWGIECIMCADIRHWCTQTRPASRGVPLKFINNSVQQYATWYLQDGHQMNLRLLATH